MLAVTVNSNNTQTSLLLFHLQQWLRQRAIILRYTYIVSLVTYGMDFDRRVPAVN